MLFTVGICIYRKKKDEKFTCCYSRISNLSLFTLQCCQERLSETIVDISVNIFNNKRTRELLKLRIKNIISTYLHTILKCKSRDYMLFKKGIKMIV